MTEPTAHVIGTDEDTGITIWGYWIDETLHITRIADALDRDLAFETQADGKYAVTLPISGSRDWGIGPYAHEDAPQQGETDVGG